MRIPLRPPARPSLIDTTVLLEHLDWVRALAYSLVRDRNVADDLVQEAWLAAERSRPIEPAAAKGWFASVLRRKVSADFPAMIRFALTQGPMMLHGDYEISALSGGSSLDVGFCLTARSPL